MSCPVSRDLGGVLDSEEPGVRLDVDEILIEAVDVLILEIRVRARHGKHRPGREREHMQAHMLTGWPIDQGVQLGSHDRGRADHLPECRLMRDRDQLERRQVVAAREGGLPDELDLDKLSHLVVGSAIHVAEDGGRVIVSLQQSRKERQRVSTLHRGVCLVSNMGVEPARSEHDIEFGPPARPLRVLDPPLQPARGGRALDPVVANQVPDVAGEWLALGVLQSRQLAPGDQQVLGHIIEVLARLLAKLPEHSGDSTPRREGTGHPIHGQLARRSVGRSPPCGHTSRGYFLLGIPQRNRTGCGPASASRHSGREISRLGWSER